MSDIKKLLSKSEEAGKPTEGEHGLLINSLSLLSKKLESELRDCDSIIVDIAIQELESLKTENAELRKQSEWISVDDFEAHLSGNDFCFVYFPCGIIKKCHLNDYRTYSGKGVYWQDMIGDDLPMLDTKFIKIEIPTPPKWE